MSFSEYIATMSISLKLVKILNAIQTSSILIEQQINRAAIDDLQGVEEVCNNTNSSGDVQKKLDIISNDIMITQLTETNCCSILLSEENEDAIIIPTELCSTSEGIESVVDTEKYMVTFDPLDGSSNIDCNCCVGTIFSIYEDFSGRGVVEDKVTDTDSVALANESDQDKDINERILKTGDEIICAGYVLYGPATEMVITFYKNRGVQKFTLDRKRNEYIYTGEINIANKTKKIYSVNESNCESWYDDMKQYISQYKVKNTKYTQRYIGSMVADVHRTLLYGGMFGYPADKKNENGKLRVIYECFPMSKIMEEAGGKSVIGKNSKKRVLEIKPDKIHQKTSVIMGSVDEISKYEAIIV